MGQQICCGFPGYLIGVLQLSGGLILGQKQFVRIGAIVVVHVMARFDGVTSNRAQRLTRDHPGCATDLCYVLTTWFYRRASS